MTLSDKKCPIGVPFGHAVCVAIEEVHRMQAVNDEGDEPDDYDVRRLLFKIERDLDRRQMEDLRRHITDLLGEP